MIAPWIVMTVLVGALLVVHKREIPGLEWLVKPAAALTFIVTGVLHGATATSFGRVILVGLCLAALGDVLLIPKSKLSFLGGLVAFLLGHVAYAVAFVVRGIDWMAAGAALVVFALVAAPVVRWLWPNVEGKMRGPVLAYVTVITGMVALSAGAARWDGSYLLFAGALAFYVSDLAVARNQFVKRAFVNRAWGLPLYFFAQMLLASQVGR